jgi:hypothetical protein
MESRLSEWQTIESRLRQESLERMKAFEQTIAREWRELREVHEEPLKQLRDQAAALGETSVAAANLALRGYERAEARLASLEADLRGQLSQLSREVHATLAEIRHERGLGGRPTPAPFQLDSVMKLHSELRDAPSAGPELANVPAQKSATAPPKPAAVPTVPAVEPVRVPEIPAPTEPAETSAAAAFAAREPFSTLKSSAPASTGSVVRIVYPRRAWRVIPVAIAVAVIAAGIFGFVRLQRGTAIGDSPAQAAAQASAGTSAQGTSSTASRDALDPANGAALAADVITSPDVIRFAMTGVGGGRGASGQVLWSRSKGIVLTASSLPAPEAGSAYRFWLLSDTHAVPVGRLQPDETGRVRLAAPNPSGLPNLIDSVAVTLEAEGSTAASPSTNTILRRAYP